MSSSEISLEVSQGSDRPTQSTNNKTSSIVSNEAEQNHIAQQSLVGSSKTKDEANLGCIWAGEIINMAITEAGAHDEIYKHYDDEVQTTYREYVHAVLEACTFRADHKDGGLQIPKGEEGWEVIEPTIGRSSLGITAKKYRQWRSLDLSDCEVSIRYHDGRRMNYSRVVPADHPVYEFQEFVRSKMEVYNDYTKSCRKALKDESSSTEQVPSMQALHYLDYRMSLMNYANRLVGLVSDTRLPRCQELDRLAIERHPQWVYNKDPLAEMKPQQTEKVFRYVLNQIPERGIFPKPIDKGQGATFEKPVYYVAWCIASLTWDIEEAEEMIGQMVKYAEQYFQKIRNFVTKDEVVIEKKSRLLEALNNCNHVLRESIFSMFKSWLAADPFSWWLTPYEHKERGARR